MPRFPFDAAAFCRSLPAVFTLLGILLAGTPRASATPTADGLYALVTTSAGQFAFQLHYDKAPMTVANFLGLAEGSRSWLDPLSGSIKSKPLYDALPIHRAEPGLLIQMGSPEIGPNGDPGYDFSDEFHPDLTHNAAGAVSMANAGADTNGSQFFVTLSPWPALNRKHAVFGTIVEGLDVVAAISNLPDNSVTILGVTILRIGAGASAFDPTQWGLPFVLNAANTRLDLVGDSQFLLIFDRTPFTEFVVHQAHELATWTRLSSPSLIHITTAPPTVLDVTAFATGLPRQFYRAVAITYQTVPTSLNGSTLTLLFKATNESLALSFAAPPRNTIDYDAPLGTYVLNGTQSGRIGAYTWTQSLRRGQCGIALEGIGVRYFNLKFNNDGTGVFTGSTAIGSNGPFPYYGSFSHGITP